MYNVFRLYQEINFDLLRGLYQAISQLVIQNKFQQSIKYGGRKINEVSILKGDVVLRVRELDRQTCEAFEIQILKGVMSINQVHIWFQRPRHRR